MSTPSATARRRLSLGLSVLALAIVLFGGCVWLGGELLRPIPPTRTPAPTPLPTQLGGGGGLIAFVSYRDCNAEIYVMNADGSGQRNLTNDPAEDFSPLWSPDGAAIAFFSNRTPTGQIGLFWMKADGSEVKPLAQFEAGTNIDFPHWSPDGRRLAVEIFSGNRPPTILIIDTNGSQRPLTDSDEQIGQADLAPSWSPDGQRLAFFRMRGGRDGSTVSLQIADSSGQELAALPMDPTAFSAGAPQWSPDGQRLAFLSGTQGQPPPFEIAVQIVGVELTNPKTISTLLNASELVWSPDNARLAVNYMPADAPALNAPPQIAVFWSDGSGFIPLTDGSEWSSHPRWSPDGKLLAYARTTSSPPLLECTLLTSPGFNNIYTQDVGAATRNPDALAPVQLTDTNVDSNPQWQP